MTLEIQNPEESVSDGPRQLALGSRYGSQSRKIRRMIASIELHGGDVVVWDIGTGQFNVTTDDSNENVLVFGVVAGGLGEVVAAIGELVDVIVEGPAIVNMGGTVTAGDQVATSGSTAGYVVTASSPAVGAVLGVALETQTDNPGLIFVRPQ